MVAAAKVMLTDRGVGGLKPAPTGKRYIVWDALQPHLGVRVTDQGAKSFVVVRRRPGARDPNTIVLGKYPAVKLKDARKDAPNVLGTLAAGRTPAELVAERSREEARRRNETFASAVADFIADGALAGLRSGRETEAILRRDFLGQVRGEVTRDGQTVEDWVAGPDPLWSKTPVAQIARRDVIARLDAIKRARGKHAARHALGAIRKFFTWCVEGERFGIEVSPLRQRPRQDAGSFAKDGRELKRKRVLTDEELRDVWGARWKRAHREGAGKETAREGRGRGRFKGVRCSRFVGQAARAHRPAFERHRAGPVERDRSRQGGADGPTRSATRPALRKRCHSRRWQRTR